jgi:hypothetical protein
VPARRSHSARCADDVPGRGLRVLLSARGFVRVPGALWTRPGDHLRHDGCHQPRARRIHHVRGVRHGPLRAWRSAAAFCDALWNARRRTCRADPGVSDHPPAVSPAVRFHRRDVGAEPYRHARHAHRRGPVHRRTQDAVRELRAGRVFVLGVSRAASADRIAAAGCALLAVRAHALRRLFARDDPGCEHGESPWRQHRPHLQSDVHVGCRAGRSHGGVVCANDNGSAHNGSGIHRAVVCHRRREWCGRHARARAVRRGAGLHPIAADQILRTADRPC